MKTQVSSIHHSFDVALATEYGIQEAILIHHFQFWISTNKRMGKNQIEGRTWTYQTQKWICAHFPYMGKRSSIIRLLDSLVKKGVLIKDRFNKNSHVRTNWYAFQDEEKFLVGVKEDPDLREEELEENEEDSDFGQCIVKNRTMDCSKPDNGVSESGQSIEDTKYRFPSSKEDLKKINLSSDVVDRGLSPPKSDDREAPPEPPLPTANAAGCPTADAVGLANSLLASIKKIKPDFKPPKTLDKWAKTFERMIRIDKRTIEAVNSTIEWLPASAFWSKTVLSAENFREHFDRLQLDMTSQQLGNWKRKNIATFNEVKAGNKEVFRHMQISGDYAVNTTNSKEIRLDMNPNSFIGLLIHISGCHRLD